MTVLDRLFRRKKKAEENTIERVGGIDTVGYPLDIYDVSDGDMLRVPRTWIPMIMVRNMFLASDVLQLVVRVLRDEIFRNGMEVVPQWEFKCLECGREFGHGIVICEFCGGKVREPDKLEKLELEKFLEKRNDFGQTLIEVLKAGEEDLEKYDNVFIFLDKDYIFMGGKLVGVNVKGVYRASPLYMRLVYSRHGKGRDDRGKYLYTCVEHRRTVHKFDRPGQYVCPKCGREMFRVEAAMEGGQQGRVYYVQGEIFHAKKYNEGVGYGISPLISIWRKVLTLIRMDEYILKNFTLERPPKGILLLRGRLDAIERAWAKLMAKARKNPNLPYPLAIEPTEEKGTGRMAEYIDLSLDLNLLQHIETREEFRRMIGAVYGVSPIFQADVSVGGGLNNEGLQITVTNRAIEIGQRIWNDIFFPWLMKQMGITEWTIRLLPNEEKDMKAQIEREQMRVNLAMAIQQLGYEVELLEGEDGIDIKLGKKIETQPPVGFPPIAGGIGEASAEQTGSPTEAGEKRALMQGFEGQPG